MTPERRTTTTAEPTTEDQGVGLRVLAGQGAQVDTTTAGGRLVFGIFAALAEFERELIRERTVAGLEAARARGRKGGRKFALSKAQVRLAQSAMAHRDTSVSELCRELGIRPVTLYRYVGPQGQVAGAGPEGPRRLNPKTAPPGGHPSSHGRRPAGHLARAKLSFDHEDPRSPSPVAAREQAPADETQPHRVEVAPARHPKQRLRQARAGRLTPGRRRPAPAESGCRPPRAGGATTPRPPRLPAEDPGPRGHGGRVESGARPRDRRSRRHPGRKHPRRRGTCRRTGTGPGGTSPGGAAREDLRTVRLADDDPRGIKASEIPQVG